MLGQILVTPELLHLDEPPQVLALVSPAHSNTIASTLVPMRTPGAAS